MTHTRPIWAEISRSRLRRNYAVLRQAQGAEGELLAVVKADAYGHGLLLCAQVLAAEGARWFGVTSVEEGVALRQVCSQARILAMSGVGPGEAEAALEYRLTPAVWEPRHLDLMEDAARRRGAGEAPVHLELDTGMSRQGVQPEHLDAVLARFAPESPLRLEALMTHFHSPEDTEATREQTGLLADGVAALLRRGLHPVFLSAGSTASLAQQETDMVRDLAGQIGARYMVRTGVGLYGYGPVPVEPVLTWKTRVTALRTIQPGTAVGYDATFRAQRPMRLALLPVGYADGLNRRLSNRGAVLVRGQRAPIAGRISMDQTVVDVTEIPGAAVGDEVVLIGEQGGDAITAAEVARETATIAYEVLCAIAARVPRVMVE